MTREDEISDASYAYWANNYANIEFIDEEEKELHSQDIQDSFINGAEWADSHPRWVSVEDELPPNKNGFSDEVLTYDYASKCYVVAIFNYISNCWFGCGDTITHWMPLPEPPKKGGEQ